MKANAKYVREGAMGYIGAEDFYKEVRYTSLATEPLGLEAGEAFSSVVP